MPIRTGMAQGVIDALVSMGLSTSLTGSRYYLHWGGVDQYAVHEPWSMSGFGDRIEFSFVADDPGTGDDYLLDTTSGNNYLKVTNTTAVLATGYLDVDGATQRVVTGPTVVAGTTYVGYIQYNADGVVLSVNGTDYTGANVPDGLKGDYTNIASEVTPSLYFNGTIHYLRYVNATPMQGVNAVMGNGVDLYGTIPEITLTGDFEIEFDWIRQEATGTGQVNLFGNSSNANVRFSVFDSGAGSSNGIQVGSVVGVNAQGSVFTDITNGQNVHVRIYRVSDGWNVDLDGVNKVILLGLSGNVVIDRVMKMSTGNPIPTDSTIQNLKITDKSGPSDVVYQYDLAGDDGDVIPNVDPVTGVLGEELLSVGQMTGPLYRDNLSSTAWPSSGFPVIAGRVYQLQLRATDLGGSNVGCSVRILGIPSNVEVYSGTLGPAQYNGQLQTIIFKAKVSGLFAIYPDNPTVNVAVTDGSLKEYPHGQWQNYDSGTDQVALPVLSRNYKMSDGPDALFLEDSLHPLGPELVANGTFDTDLTGWTLFNGTAVWDAGRLKQSGEGTYNTYSKQVLSLVEGRTYVLTADVEVEAGIGGASQFGIWENNSDASDIAFVPLPVGISQQSIVFVAAATNQVRLKRATNVGSSWFDNISVKCINTGAVLYNVDPTDWDKEKS